MDPILNPFTPGAGTRPPALAGRESIIDEATISIKRAIIGNHCRSQMLLGLRGVGKTEPTRVFRRQFILSHATLADSSNWR